MLGEALIFLRKKAEKSTNYGRFGQANYIIISLNFSIRFCVFLQPQSFMNGWFTVYNHHLFPGKSGKICISYPMRCEGGEKTMLAKTNNVAIHGKITLINTE